MEADIQSKLLTEICNRDAAYEHRRKVRHHGIRSGAGGSEGGAALAGATRAPLRTLHRRRMASTCGRWIFRNDRSVDRREDCGRRAGIRGRCRRRGEGRSRALPKWQALTPHARARYLYAMARTMQKHSRRLAVLETMDNGKPIRESRDIDIPLVARHFYHHAGWAQLLEQEFPGYAAVRRGRADHSVEFSAADAGVEDCAGAGDGKYGRPEAGGVYAADRAGLRGDLPGNRACRRVW